MTPGIFVIQKNSNPPTPVKTNNRLIARERIARYAELKNLPIIGKGSLYYHYEGTQAGTYALYERANDSGGIRVIRRFKSIPLLISYLDGQIDAIVSAKGKHGTAPDIGYARAHINCSPHEVDGKPAVSIDSDYFCFDFFHTPEHYDAIEKALETSVDTLSIHSFYIQRAGTTVIKSN